MRQSSNTGPKAAPAIHAWLLFLFGGGTEKLDAGALNISNYPAAGLETKDLRVIDEVDDGTWVTTVVYA